MKTIQTKEDVVFLVDRFYEKVNTDDLLAPIFNDFAKVNWETHMPVMYAFWSSILLGEASYSGRPFPKHLPLPIQKEHFNRWLELFHRTVDDNFEGELAIEAKNRASTIAQIFSHKIKSIKGTL
jgi:hemoglobin